MLLVLQILLFPYLVFNMALVMGERNRPRRQWDCCNWFQAVCVGIVFSTLLAIPFSPVFAVLSLLKYLYLLLKRFFLYLFCNRKQDRESTDLNEQMEDPLDPEQPKQAYGINS